MKPTFEAEQGHDTETAGGEMHRWIEGLYPICRSITGDGLRSTLKEIGARIPLEIHEVPSGTEVLDWTVPKEWNIRDAYVLDASGRKVIDFARSNLHVLGYSVPVHARLQEALASLHGFRPVPVGAPTRRCHPAARPRSASARRV